MQRYSRYSRNRTKYTTNSIAKTPSENLFYLIYKKALLLQGFFCDTRIAMLLPYYAEMPRRCKKNVEAFLKYPSPRPRPSQPAKALVKRFFAVKVFGRGARGDPFFSKKGSPRKKTHFLHFTPVCPKPPAPRSVSSKDSTCANVAV